MLFRSEQQDYIYPTETGSVESPSPECTPIKMKNALMTHFLGRTKSVKTGYDNDNNEPTYEDVSVSGRLKPQSMIYGVKSLTSVFYKHFYDKAVVSAALTIEFHGCSLKNYLRFY